MAANELELNDGEAADGSSGSCKLGGMQVLYYCTRKITDVDAGGELPAMDSQACPL